jgi:hypothetical protein
MRAIVVAGVMLAVSAVSCVSSKSTTRSDAHVYQVKQQEKVGHNYHLKESQKVIKANQKHQTKTERKEAKFRNRQEKYLAKLNEYNRYKSQNRNIGAFNFY